MAAPIAWTVASQWAGDGRRRALHRSAEREVSYGLTARPAASR